MLRLGAASIGGMRNGVPMRGNYGMFSSFVTLASDAVAGVLPHRAGFPLVAGTPTMLILGAAGAFAQLLGYPVLAGGVLLIDATAALFAARASARAAAVAVSRARLQGGVRISGLSKGAADRNSGL